MAKTREEVCLYYIAFGQCKKNREAVFSGYCQKCNKYYPRSRTRHTNRKREELEKIKKNEGSRWA